MRSGDTWRLELTRRRRYGFWNFVLDAILVLITHGLWFIWIFVREMRRS